MSRISSILVRFIQEIDPVSCAVKSIRIKSQYSHLRSGTQFFFSKWSEGDWPKLISLLHETGFRVGDLIGFNEESAEQINSESLKKFEDLFSTSDEIFLYLSDENTIHPSALVEELQKNTIFGLPVELYQNYRILHLKIYFGANSIDTKITKNNVLNEQLRAKDGVSFICCTNESGKIEFNYLTDSNKLKNKKVNVENYLSTEILQNTNRFKHTVKKGLSIYCFFSETEFRLDVPFSNWTYLIESINSIASVSLETMLKNQVSAIERRISLTTQRARVFYNGEELGLVPENEQETVILYERYLAKNNYRLGQDARLKLLDYSPHGIDSVCSFSSDLNEPLTAVAVEFEFILKNFFDHGHDPRQVKLVLCYSMKSLSFPYDHFGIVFDVDRTGKLPRLINTITKNSCYVFALEDVVQERGN
jgi:hypothetical protein